MAKNRLADLRDHLFETIERLKDEDKPMEVERAKAIAGVAQTIIDSAKVEVHAAELLGFESPSEFLGQHEPARPRLTAGGKKTA